MHARFSWMFISAEANIWVIAFKKHTKTANNLILGKIQCNRSPNRIFTCVKCSLVVLQPHSLKFVQPRPRIAAAKRAAAPKVPKKPKGKEKDEPSA